MLLLSILLCMWYHAGIAEIPLMHEGAYGNLPRRMLGGRGTAPNLFMLRHPKTHVARNGGRLS